MAWTASASRPRKGSIAASALAEARRARAGTTRPASAEVASRTSAAPGERMLSTPAVASSTSAEEANGSHTRTTRSWIDSTSAITRVSRSPRRRPSRVVRASAA